MWGGKPRMMIHPLLVVMLFSSMAGAVALFFMIRNAKRLRFFGTLRAGCCGLACVLITAVCGLFLIAHHGYRSLTHEELAAKVEIVPSGKQRFTARFTLPGGGIEEFDCSGDELYVDAHILKWHPLLNLVGVRTTYELDRVAGRYHTLEDERKGPRTVYSLSKSCLFNIFHLRKRFHWMSPFLDAEYGSATFVESDGAATYRVMVSTSGLLGRRER